MSENPAQYLPRKLTRQSLWQQLEKMKAALSAISESPEWEAIATDETEDPELNTHINDAIHYLSAILETYEP